MSKLIKLVCAAAAFGMVRGPARAQDKTCKFAEMGYSYYRIEQQGEAWTYLLTSSGPHWRNKPYGYHAPGFLDCESCSSAGKGWAGVYDFDDHATEIRTKAKGGTGLSLATANQIVKMQGGRIRSTRRETRALRSIWRFPRTPNLRSAPYEQARPCRRELRRSARRAPRIRC
jgi:hypothetical protein